MDKFFEVMTGISKEIVTAQFDTQLDEEKSHDLATSWAESDYEAIPEEFRIPYDHKLATAYKEYRYKAYSTMLSNRILDDTDPIVADGDKVSTYFAMSRGKPCLVKGVLPGGRENLRKAVYNLAVKKAAKEMGLL